MPCVRFWREDSARVMPAVHRIGRRPDPWEYPDWSRANSDGTFGNRFDDPDGEYRVLYASSARLGCFLETLARYRPDLTLYAEFGEIEGEDDFVGAGVVPREWLDIRVMGSAEAQGQFADIGASEWISTLRRRLASLLIRLSIPDFDASVLQRSGPRELTQKVSKFVYRQGFNLMVFGTFQSTDTTSRIGRSSSLQISGPRITNRSGPTTQTSSKPCVCSTWSW